ncbi:MAG: SNF2-related protein [Candidatus Pseudobacter hemicellulosilyticus]|uniref:SNF2-related protein n=1 Tax=Candidatus Pseudobacter hemicellulosilyticus TaxID=3121375 RepID=A0AAJ5WQ60_9BACT|nr:MAG: SNF2-related protein [Pseudobacter sp.]
MAIKEETKTVLLLTPQRMLDDHQLLESLLITKNNKGIFYTNQELDHAEIRRAWEHLPKPAKEAMHQFSRAGISQLQGQVKQKFTIKRAGIAFDNFYRNAMLREMHQQLEALKPFSPLIRWFHKLKTDKTSYKTGPCSLSTFKPQLHFEVVKNDNGLALQTAIHLNGANYPLQEFNRFHFLLESRNEYYLLAYKDFQTLEWLQQQDLTQYAQQPQALATQVLSRLEDMYTVQRNNHFEQQLVESVPVNRVLLSELNNAFLMLTPQWLYDGFLIDGPWKASTEITRHGETFLIARNKEAEQQFTQLLEGLHANFSRQLNGYYYLSFSDAQKKQWFPKAYHKLLELNIELTGMDMLQHFRYSPHKPVTELELKKEEDNILVMQFKVTIGDEEIPGTELQKILLAGQRTVMLKDGSLGILNEEWLQQYATIIKHAKLSKKELRVSKWLAFGEQPRNEEGGLLKPAIQTGWRDKWQHWQSSEDILFPVPETVNATLRPYQQKGYEWMQLLSEAGAGACLADDMGLGKTLQTICFLARQVLLAPEGKHLIICPSSLIYNWQQELQKFAPAIPTLVFHGSDRDTEGLANHPARVIITSYGTVRSDIELLGELTFGAVVLDESHNIKNPSAQITRAVARLQAATRIALSGTPVMNNTFDLYAQVDFLLPGIFGSREFFKREYADPIDHDKDEDKIHGLRKLTAPFILRRTKGQVARDLPEKTEMVMWCDMGSSQKAQYDAIKESIRSSLFLNIKSEGLGKSKLAVLQGMLKLRQVCNSPLLLPKEEQESSESVKTALLMEELTNNLKDHKVLVFSQFTSMLDLLAGACREKGISFYHFDGQTPPAKRAEMVAGFQEPDNTTNVFLISLKAGNAGLNLTAADYVFLFDPWWNTAVQQQAIDRTHRIGQTKNIFAYKMICKDTIEEKIIQLQTRKKQLAEDLVSEDEGFVKSLTEEDIQFLFS